MVGVAEVGAAVVGAAVKGALVVGAGVVTGAGVSSAGAGVVAGAFESSSSPIKYKSNAQNPPASGRERGERDGVLLFSFRGVWSRTAVVGRERCVAHARGFALIENDSLDEVQVETTRGTG